MWRSKNVQFGCLGKTRSRASLGPKYPESFNFQGWGSRGWGSERTGSREWFSGLVLRKRKAGRVLGAGAPKEGVLGGFSGLRLRKKGS